MAACLGVALVPPAAGAAQPPAAPLLASEEQIAPVADGIGTPVGVVVDYESGDVIVAGEGAAVELDSRLDQVIASTPIETDLEVVGVAGRNRFLAARDGNLVAIDASGTETAVLTRSLGDGARLSVSGDDGTVQVLSGGRDRVDVITVDDAPRAQPIPRAARGTVLAAHPDPDLVYLVDRNGISVLDEGGRTVSRYRFHDFDAGTPLAATFGPSADPTDDPQELSLFLVSQDDPDSGVALREVTLVQPLVTEAAVVGTLLKITDLSLLSPPSPDPAGVTFVSHRNRLLVSDSEVDEMPIYQGANLFETALGGTLADTGTTLPWSREPTGVSYNPTSRWLYVSDDGGSGGIYLVNPRTDGRYGTADDAVTFVNLGTFAADVDSEGVAYDPFTGTLLVADGVGKEVWRISPGLNGIFEGGAPAGDDTATHFDMEVHGSADPEGIAVDPVTGRILVIDRKTEMVYEVTPAGALVRTIDLAAANPVSPAGVVLAPASTGSGTHLYFVARGVDNGANPNENDGKLYEMEAGFGSAPAPGTPVAVGDAATTAEDTAVTVGVLGNDSDPDNDPLTVTNLTQPQNGTATLNPDQTVTYTPDPDYSGTDTFTYTAHDGTTSSTPATVTITVTPVNDTPLAAADTATTLTDTPVTVNVLANDDDPDNDPLTVTNLTQPQAGTATLNPDRTVTYTPNPGYTGTDTFTYTAHDGTTTSNTATVTITVTDAPANPAILGTAAQVSALNPTSLTVTHDLGSGPGRRVFLVVGMDDSGANNPQVTSATYGGVAATRVTDGTTAAYSLMRKGGSTAAEVWEVREAALPASGSHQAVVQFNTTMDAAFLVVVAVEQVDQAANVDAVVVATSTKKAYSTSITTVGPNAFVLDSLATSTHLGGHTPGPGQTELTEQDLLSVAGHVSQYETAPTGGTVPISGTLGQSQARIAHVVIALGSQ